MINIEIDLARITDRDSFHQHFAHQMGFPDFYGENLDAWVDCMSDISIDDARTGMTQVVVPLGDHLLLTLLGAEQFSQQQPELLNILIDLTATVNARVNRSETIRYILLLPL